MNEIRKLMETLNKISEDDYENSSAYAHGEDGGPPESVEHDVVDPNGISIMFYDDQVAIENDDSDYPIFIPFETWRAFVSASIRKYGEENIL